MKRSNTGGRTIAQAVSCLKPRRPGLAPRVVYVGFVVDKVAMEQVSIQVIRLLPVNIMSPILHIHSSVIEGLDNGPDKAVDSTVITMGQTVSARVETQFPP